MGLFPLLTSTVYSQKEQFFGGKVSLVFSNKEVCSGKVVRHEVKVQEAAAVVHKPGLTLDKNGLLFVDVKNHLISLMHDYNVLTCQPS